jgi:hypothetical protein
MNRRGAAPGRGPIVAAARAAATPLAKPRTAPRPFTPPLEQWNSGPASELGICPTAISLSGVAYAANKSIGARGGRVARARKTPLAAPITYTV